MNPEADSLTSEINRLNLFLSKKDEEIASLKSEIENLKKADEAQIALLCEEADRLKFLLKRNENEILKQKNSNQDLEKKLSDLTLDYEKIKNLNSALEKEISNISSQTGKKFF